MSTEEGREEKRKGMGKAVSKTSLRYRGLYQSCWWDLFFLGYPFTSESITKIIGPPMDPPAPNAVGGLWNGLFNSALKQGIVLQLQDVAAEKTTSHAQRRFQIQRHPDYIWNEEIMDYQWRRDA